MRVVVVGGSGHIGSFLIPRLVRAGFDVTNISRGSSSAYVEAGEWQQVRSIAADREQEDRAGVFGDRVAELGADVVVDLICFTVDSASALVDRLRGEVGHLLHCGSIWRYGPSEKLPISEVTGGTAPIGEYGINKQRIAELLKQETASGGLPTTSIHPGHIVGPGWAPIGPLGNLDPAVWYSLSGGWPLLIPGLGVELMHHVHADDVAQAFELAISRPHAAAGEDFNIVAPDALNVRGFAHQAAGWFGQEAQLESVTWEEFRASTATEHAEASWSICSAVTAWRSTRPPVCWATSRGTNREPRCSRRCTGWSSTTSSTSLARSCSRELAGRRASDTIPGSVPCFVYLRADPNPIHCNEAPDEVLKRVEASGPDKFVHLATTPYGHDDAVRTAYARAGIAAILPMHPRELEADLDEPPDWYQR